MTRPTEEVKSFKPSQLIIDLRYSGRSGGYWNPTSKNIGAKPIATRAHSILDYSKPPVSSDFKKDNNFRRPSPLSQSLTEVHVAKANAPRWIKGAMVKDSSCQTTHPFKQEQYQLSMDSYPVTVTEELDDITRYFGDYESETPSSRCRAPNADEMSQSNAAELYESMRYMELIQDRPLVSSFVPKSLEGPRDQLQISTSDYCIRPRPIRPGHTMMPSTPISDRSVSVLSEDGNSSVSSFSLPSSICSPDSTKFVNILDKASMSSTSFYNPIGGKTYPNHFRYSQGFVANIL